LNLEKPLFTICIITYNRGQLALELVENILPSVDANWEVLVLDNASTLEKDKYAQIEEMSATHINLRYVRHSENRQFHGNYLASFQNVLSDYFMIVSDEDTPDITNINSFIETFENNENLGILRASIGFVGSEAVGNAYDYPDEYFKPGEESLMNFSFTNNYISGVMYNKRVIAKYDLLYILEKKAHVNAAYPHIFFDLIVSSKCDVMMTSEKSVYEGKPQAVKDETGQIVGSSDTYIGAYSLGERLNQFKVLRDGIMDAVTLIDGTFDGILYLKLYLRLVQKYYYLICIVQEPMYLQNHIDSPYVKQIFKNMAYGCVMSHQDLEVIRADVFRILDEFFRDSYQL